MSLIEQVVKMDVDTDGKASGAFLRGRVAIEIDKPLHHGVILRMSMTEDPRWFAMQYDRLPFYCFACRVLGHSEVECDHLVTRGMRRGSCLMMPSFGHQKKRKDEFNPSPCGN